MYLLINKIWINVVVIEPETVSKQLKDEEYVCFLMIFCFIRGLTYMYRSTNQDQLCNCQHFGLEKGPSWKLCDQTLPHGISCAVSHKK